jgi:hypothetical protein
LTDTFSLEVVGNDWPISLSSDSLNLGSCKSGRITATVDVPGGLPANTIEQFEIVATSIYSPSFSEHFPIQLKTPGHILLVDDDRWYDQEPVFRSSLEVNGFDYDFWEIGSSPIVQGSPAAHLLAAYDIVIWYTGYDWFDPITEFELEALESYLSQGGNLFLTSQDYLSRYDSELLTKQYFGVHSFRESITPTTVFASGAPAFLDVITQALPLEFGPYQNFGDGLVASNGAGASLWHDGGMAAGLAAAGDYWRTVFWAIPFETLPDGERDLAMNHIVGWLSHLGDSTFEVDRRSAAATFEVGEFRTFSLTLRAIQGTGPGTVAVTNTVPEELSVKPGSITGGALYDHQSSTLTWQGILTGGEEHFISYQAAVAPGVSAGTLVDNRVELFNQAQDLRFFRSAPLWVGTPDLSASHFTVYPQVARPGSLVTYHLQIINSTSASGSAVITIYFPKELSPFQAGTTPITGTPIISGRQVAWQGSIAGEQRLTLTVVVTAPHSAFALRIPSVALISDGISNIVVKDVAIDLNPFRTYLPVSRKYSP